MNRFAFSLAALALVGCASDPEPAPADPAAETADRQFRMRYVVELADLPTGKELQLWIPVPGDDPHQTIGELEVEAPWTHSLEVEPIHGNRMLSFKGSVESASATVTVSYAVTRREHRVDLNALASDGEEDLSPQARYLEPTRMVVIDDTVKSIAAEVGAGKTTTLSKARAFYDHVLAQMAYDKTVEGWGRGDTTFACEVGKGNCTDFHSYFKSLCMEAGIPCRFQIGMWGKYERAEGEYKSGGYHCWAEFYVPGHGWVPVDISEADKDPSKADYFFGAHTANRCTLSTGRDLVLAPAQQGEPLNFFVDPYAEVDGQPFPVKKTPYWTDQ